MTRCSTDSASSASAAPRSCSKPPSSSAWRVCPGATVLPASPVQAAAPPCCARTCWVSGAGRSAAPAKGGARRPNGTTGARGVSTTTQTVLILALPLGHLTCRSDAQRHTRGPDPDVWQHGGGEEAAQHSGARQEARVTGGGGGKMGIIALESTLAFWSDDSRP